MIRAVAIAAALIALGPACRGGDARAPTRIPAAHAIVKFTTAVADAGLWIDGTFVGTVGALRGGVVLDPGAHRVEVRDEAYFVHYQELDLAPGQRLTLAIDLAPLLP